MATSDSPAWIATARFGLGARGSELEQARRSPRRWVLDQLGTTAAPPALIGLPSTRDTASAFFAARQQGEEAKRAARRAQRQLYRRECAARLRAGATTTTPVIERLVQFWSNHFTVSVARNQVTGIAGSFEREAIRPHVLGRFEDLLLAVARHPAMLLYLDNARSTGPDSMAGQRRDLGLNENLAREILELHTLGVDGGYTQSDVQGLAALLTGWSVAGPRDDEPGTFRFARRRHQPGPKTLLDATYGEGEAEGERALRHLARHPSTARFLARKLATHYVADAPRARLVDRLARVFLDTGGDLQAVTVALIEDEASWEHPGAKIRSPNDFVVACARALPAMSSDDALLLLGLRSLNQMPWSAPSPAGWSDRAEDLVGPEAVLRRVEWAERLGRRYGDDIGAAELSRAVLPAVPRGMLATLKGAGDPREALALLLASPAFLRR